MTKLLNSVLDKISENNNEYRSELRTLNNLIDEKTTALVGDVVTLSNYMVDFSSTITLAKEKLVNPISRVIESYVIKDLRSVENVNEQFVEKINDKIDETNLDKKEDKDKFKENLNTLLNEKYLEIVKIKRVNFLNDDNVNDDLENCFNDFENELKKDSFYDINKLEEIMQAYKNEIYELVNNTLNNISNLYLNNFTNGISESLNGLMDYDNNLTNDNFDLYRPNIPDINPIQEVNVSDIPPIPNYNESDSTLDLISSDDKLEITDIPSIPDIPQIPDVTQTEDAVDVIEPIKVPEIKLDEPIINTIDKQSKKSYDVEEILKIAKSPVASISNDEKEQENNNYVSLTSLLKEEKSDVFQNEFNEKEIVEELINRLKNRLEQINERQSKYDEEIAKLQEDEAFVNDLIQSSNNKKEELNKFEEELNLKEKELKEKEEQLNKKISDVLPFANAVLKSEES